MNNYYDSFGRIHDKPVTAADPYPCNNSFLFTGEASLLNVPVDVTTVWRCYYGECATKYGYNRNPGGAPLPASSHDEIVGLFMMCASSSLVMAGQLYDQLNERLFQVCNLEGFKPTPIYKLNPLKVVRDFWRLSREEKPRTATYKYPYIWPIVFRHLPQHTYFYARCAGIAPDFIHSAYHFFAGLHTVYRGNNSSRVMLGFKLLKLNKLGLTRTEKVLKWFYNKRVRFATEVVQYFPKNHPIAIATLREYGDSVYSGGGI
ncbi:MAG TPA: hypothetical protein VGD26_13915 [Chitinophagaceae bacterium]